MSVTKLFMFPVLVTQVKVYNLMQYEHGADDVLVMGTDGLWDVLSNQEVAEAVTSFLANCDPDDLHRSDFISFRDRVVSDEFPQNKKVDVLSYRCT